MKAAILNGIQNSKATYRGYDASGPLRITMFFVKRDRRWLIAGYQASQIMEAPPQFRQGK